MNSYLATKLLLTVTLLYNNTSLKKLDEVGNCKYDLISITKNKKELYKNVNKQPIPLYKFIKNMSKNGKQLKI